MSGEITSNRFLFLVLTKFILYVIIIWYLLFPDRVSQQLKGVLMHWKANFQCRGRELTVYFDVEDIESNVSKPCEKCGEELDHSGRVIIRNISDGGDIGPSNIIWSDAEKRLNKLFQHHLCAEHLWQLAKRRNISLD